MSYVLLRRKLSVLLLAAAVFATVPADAIGSQPLLRGQNAKGVLHKFVGKVLPNGLFVIGIAFGSVCSLNGCTAGDSKTERIRGDRRVEAAQAKHYVDEYIHYLDQEGRTGIGRVVRTFQDEDGETFLLTDGNEVAADQLMGVSRDHFGWGEIVFNDTIFFSTEHAEALDTEAHALVADERHSIIKAKVDKIFSSYYIKAIHALDNGGRTYKDETEAEFLIHRDKIIHHID